METMQHKACDDLPRTISVTSITKRDASGATICDTGVTVQVLGRELCLSYQLPEDHIAPMFSGTAWAGTMIWEAAVLMSEYLIHHFNGRLQSKKVIELGAGIGLPGMVCALMGAEVLLTEHEDLAELLKSNLRANFSSDSSIGAMTLDWEDADELNDVKHQDIVLCCDCVYEPLYGKSWQPLIGVLQHLCSENHEADVYIALERRTADGVDEFMAALNTFFSTRVVFELGPIVILSSKLKA